MSFDFTRINVDKFIHGSLDVSYLPGDPIMSAVLNGPVYVGLPLGAPVPKANMMVGPPVPPVLPTLSNILTVPISLWVDGIDVHVGLALHMGARIQKGVNIVVGTRITKGIDLVKGVRITNAANITTGSFILGSIAPTRGINPTIAAALATKKGFDLKHPSKEGHRLRYVCTETPEAGVYIRGKSTSEVIELPEYWKDFVHEDSITVNLTPIKCFQQLYVQRIEDNKIYVGGGMCINGAFEYCYYYTIFAERKDGDRNIPEYEGETPADYPGDSNQFSIAGWDYDRRQQ